jgi:NAD(P)-dependent dehydrogenase (short-subunit alcohol dehydrogenase family)
MRIEGAGAIVMGGASGLGEATARALAGRGARLVVADVNEEKGQGLAGELGARFVRADVTRGEEVEAAVGAAAAAEGGLRIAINCAGVGWAERISHKRGPHNLEMFEKVVQINLIGTFNALRFESAAMAQNEPQGDAGERGVCVNTASIAAYDGQIGQVAYAASKGGVVGMTLPAARDLSGVGVRVCTIAPGLFDTPLLAALPQEARDALGQTIPFPRRLGLPDEYAALAVHIVENVMLNGETVRLDGALRMAPK